MTKTLFDPQKREVTDARIAELRAEAALVISAVILSCGAARKDGSVQCVIDQNILVSLDRYRLVREDHPHTGHTIFRCVPTLSDMPTMGRPTND